MYPNPYIIQWNCNGITSRIQMGELQRLIKDYNPICLCLQHLGKYNTTIKNYQLASQSLAANDELGTGIYVHNDIVFDQVNITNSNFQYSAVTLRLPSGTKYTVCNMYNQPIFRYNFNDLKRIINSMPKPMLLVGDLNAHNPLWDDNCREPDNAGTKFEEILDEFNLHCLNVESVY